MNLFNSALFSISNCSFRTLIVLPSSFSFKDSPIQKITLKSSFEADSSFSGNSLLKRSITKITKPKYSLSLYIIILYFWHIPFFYNAALQNNGIHYLNHLLFFFASIIYWWPIIGPSPVKSSLSVVQKIIYVLIAITPSAALAAFITFSPTALYDYTSTPLHWNIVSHVEDQRWGGIIMWLPGNFLFFGFLIGLFFFMG